MIKMENFETMKSLKLTLILSIMLFCEMHDASAQRYRYHAAQRYNYDEGESMFFFGIGTGLDYGGLGVKIEGTPIPYLGIFGGVGYNFRGLGLNGGLSFKENDERAWYERMASNMGHDYFRDKGVDLTGWRDYWPGTSEPMDNYIWWHSIMDFPFGRFNYWMNP